MNEHTVLRQWVLKIFSRVPSLIFWAKGVLDFKGSRHVLLSQSTLCELGYPINSSTRFSAEMEKRVCCICKGISFGLQRIKWHITSASINMLNWKWEERCRIVQCPLSVSPGHWKERSCRLCTAVLANLWHKVPLPTGICTVWIRSTSVIWVVSGS